MNPLVKWSGGKKDELSNILPHIPKNFNIYLEPFVGGGALFFKLNHNKCVISDVHKDLIDLYQSIKDGHSRDIHTFMEQNENNEETYYTIRSSKPQNKLDNAKKFYYLRKTCYRGMLRYNNKGEFNIPFGRYKTYNYQELLNEKYENIFRNTDIFNCDFEYLFQNYNDENNFMFLDPPYDSEFTNYGYCSFGKDVHIKLHNYFVERIVKCLLIIGKTVLSLIYTLII
jgi:DNA adenine methylase